jgi:protein associated with RNAse G/E
MNAQTITIFKQNHLGEPIFSWKGELLTETPTSRLVSARFSGADAVPVDNVTFQKGDLMLEQYYTDRWYNLFEIHHGSSNQVKCWYINLCLPAQFGAETIIWQDLALDLVVYPNGEYGLLDEDEFEDLRLEPDLKTHCLETVQEILSNPDLIKPGLVFQPGR